MSLTEFQLIKQYFEKQLTQRDDVILGVGDDAAVTRVPAGHELVFTVDTLVESIHFPKDTKPFDIAYKAITVSLSDLAAMGAEPAWVGLGLTMPTAEEAWLDDFAKGLHTQLQRYHCQLIGGDVTKGPLTIATQALGFVPRGKVLKRSGAKVGDRIFVTNTLGDAGLALQALDNKVSLRSEDKATVLTQLNCPEPRVDIGLVIRDIASACIDISDGLVADLGHIVEQSQVGAVLNIDNIPFSKILQSALPKEDALMLALTAGDDYELCFAVPVNKLNDLQQLHLPVVEVGEVTKAGSLVFINDSGENINLSLHGYEHFN